MPQMRDHAVALAPSGALAVNATSVGEPVALEIALAGPILPAESRWVAREHKLDFAIAKAERGRWAALLAAPYAGVVKTDWSKYVDLDDELDPVESAVCSREDELFGLIASEVYVFYCRCAMEVAFVKVFQRRV